MKKKALTTESPLQQKAFLIYFDLGEKRSQEMVVKKLGEVGEKISETSIANWSKKHNWVKRVSALDREIYEKTEALAVRNATMKKSQILEICKNTMVRYNELLLSKKTRPTARDVKPMWEIARKELGLDIAGSVAPVQIVLNQKVLQIVVDAENKAKQVIEAEIVDE